MGCKLLLGKRERGRGRGDISGRKVVVCSGRLQQIRSLDVVMVEVLGQVGEGGHLVLG